MQLHHQPLQRAPASPPAAYAVPPVWTPSNAHLPDISSYWPDPIWKGGRLHPFQGQALTERNMPD